MKQFNAEEFFSKRKKDPERFLRERRARLHGRKERKDEIHLGEDPVSSKDVALDLKTLRTHLHIIGATGTGKSKLMELLIRQLMFGGHGLCVIDPHGSLYKDVVSFVARFPRLAKRIILFNPGEEQSLWPGFNPLARTSYLGDVAVQVKYLTNAVAKVWGEESKETPLVRENWIKVFYPLIGGGLTFLEAEFFADLSDPGPRRKLAPLADKYKPRVRRQWESFELLPYRDQKWEVGSFERRVYEFVDTKAVRMVLGRTENVLDMEDIFENQKILLVNLSPGRQSRLHHDDGYMLGTLLISEMVNYARSRTERMAKQRPFFLFVDEFQNFITPDVTDILNECRKFGLHLILAHQHLAQLREEDPVLYGSVKTNAKTKIVFGGLDPEDTKPLVENLFLGELDLKEVKDEILRTAVVGYEKKSVTSSSQHWSHTDDESRTGGRAIQYGADQGILLGPNEVGSVVSDADSSRSSDSYGEGEGESEVYVPILGKEVASRTFYSLEEQRYRKMVELHKQPTQHAIVKILDKPTRRVRIRTVESFPGEERAEEKVQQVSYQHQAGYYMPEEQITGAIAERQRALLEQKELAEPESFEQSIEDEDLVLEKVKKARKKR